MSQTPPKTPAGNAGRPAQAAPQAPHKKEQQRNGPAQTARRQPESPENAAKRS